MDYFSTVNELLDWLVSQQSHRSRRSRRRRSCPTTLLTGTSNSRVLYSRLLLHFWRENGDSVLRILVPNTVRQHPQIISKTVYLVATCPLPLLASILNDMHMMQSRDTLVTFALGVRVEATVVLWWEVCSTAYRSVGVNRMVLMVVIYSYSNLINFLPLPNHKYRT